MRCDLLKLNKPCEFLSIITPCVDKIKHDHGCYTTNDVIAYPANDSDDGMIDDVSLLASFFKEELTTEVDVLEQLHLTLEERTTLEKETRGQSNNSKWYDARRMRITGSKCGRILNQTLRSESLLQFVLYPKPMIYIPKPILWGKQNEANARTEYVKYMRSHGHLDLVTEEAGFVVHVENCWLGASPDSWVIDPSSESVRGLAEFKCPYTKADITPYEACQDQNFCCTIVNGQLQLKRNHQYYHQVQLQLYVASDICKWCDFCIYTTKGVVIERIYFDNTWLTESYSKLESYFFEVMLPEINFPQHKPSYYL